MFVGVLALKIHMSVDAHNALMAFPEFVTEFRGDICVKVKFINYIIDQFYAFFFSILEEMLDHIKHKLRTVNKMG